MQANGTRGKLLAVYILIVIVGAGCALAAQLPPWPGPVLTLWSFLAFLGPRGGP